MRCVSFLIILLSCVFGLPATAQTTGESFAEIPDAPTLASLGSVTADYRVGPNDLLEIVVVGQTDLNETLRVSNSGEISYPMLGLVPVADLTPFEIEFRIANALQDEGLLVDPEVLVFVRDYQAKPVYISGAVLSPGEFVMSQELTLVDAILLAGGLLARADDHAYVHRRAGPAAFDLSPDTVIQNPGAERPGVEVITVDLKPFKEGRFLEDSFALQSGDLLIVPEADMSPFFVVGEVLSPRNYFFSPKDTVTASQAISYAHGPTPTAKLSEGMLVRYDEQGERIELKVDYEAILQGEQDDFPIQANDIIFIPGSKVATITQGLLGLTDTMVMQQSFRFARRYQLPDTPDREAQN